MKFKKFRSSGSVGGETFCTKPTEKSDPSKKSKDDIVRRLRERADKYEIKSETAPVERAVAYEKIAKELRGFAVGIRLDQWNDMDEL